MLKSVDILIGLSVVMLVVSMAVTMINQVILNLLASRGQNLRDGLADLLELLDAGMTRKEAETIAEKTLSHPIIGGKIWSWLPSWLRPIFQFFKYGNVIHRDEFIKILLGFGASHNAEITALLNRLGDEISTGTAPKADITATLDMLKEKLKKTPEWVGNRFEDKIKKLDAATTIAVQKTQYELLKSAVSKQTAPFETLLSVLKANGIVDPATTLKNVRMLALEYEKSHPELAHDVRQTNALLQEASSEFLAKINLNFDQVIDRVSVRFTSTARVVSFFSAAAVAIVLQLDTVNVMNRLVMDDAMRAAFVEEAIKLDADKTKDRALNSKAEAGKLPSGNGEEDQIKPITEEDKAKQDTKNTDTKNEKEYLVFLANQGVISLPTSFTNWWENWIWNNDRGNVSISGVFLSILLLSLGAPFWYNILSKLLQLRSLLAQKDDEQKNIRQTTQAPGITPPTKPE